MKTLGPLLVLALLLLACGAPRELDEAARILIGTVYVVGNEPFANLAIQTDDRGVRIVQKDTTELYRRLWKLQGQKIRIHFRPSEMTSDSIHIIAEHFEIVKD